MRKPSPYIAIANIPTRLARLRERGDYQCSFGADSHRFKLNSPIREAEIVKFERHHNINLPPDYRLFLLIAGNGGAGPDYGVHKLGCADEDKPWRPDDWLIGDLSAPFPHTQAWNPVPFTAAGEGPDDAALEAIQAEYFALKHVNGAIPICQRGCNLRFWLVITGTATGHVWYDRRVEWNGLSPVKSGAAKRASFVDWYCDWLDETERKSGIDFK